MAGLDTVHAVDSTHAEDASPDTLHAADAIDPADAKDADIFEEIANNPLSHTNPEPCPPAEAQTPRSLAPPLLDAQPPALPPLQPTEADTDSLDTTPQVIVDRFPHGSPGAPITGAAQGTSIYQSSCNVFGTSVWAPFHSQVDWEIAHWAKMRGLSSSAMAELLAIPGVVDKLRLSFGSTKELNDIIDKALPGRPPFEARELVIGGETLELHVRNILACIHSIYGDPEFAQDLLVAPEHHFADQEWPIRIYGEMHTGDWWWAVQTSLESNQLGATVIPVLISSDKTQLTMFRSKMAYPVYVTIGNVPKETRRKPSRHAQMLVAYIPTTKLEGITNKAGRCCAMANLYHSCMQLILSPITAYGVTYTGIAMMSGDGIWRRCHPIYAAFVGDYPEQVLVTCTYNNWCPKCLVPHDKLGTYETFPPRDCNEARDTYLLANGDARAFHLACREAGLKPIFHPFWESLPLTDVFVSITPDILHQLLQGVFKHLVAWLIKTFGPAAIDTRCQSMPPNHNISIFTKGISSLSRVTGKEHKNMSRILLGLILDLPVPNGQVSPRIIAATRALLDFLFLAQLPSHLSTTLARIEDSLSRFHNNKDIFVNLGICDNFNIPKLHSLLHYIPSIRLFGTTDNYNTEQTERLHIDLTKDAFDATNRKNKGPQMTTWNERREKVQLHSLYIKWRQQTNDIPPLATPIGPPHSSARSLRMALNPTLRAVSFEDLAQNYGAVNFQDALADIIAHINHPTASGAALSDLASNTLLPFHSVPVHHKIKFSKSDGSEIVDNIHARPEQRDVCERRIPSRFDTVLICGKPPSSDELVHGIDGHRITQVRVVFELPNRVIQEVFTTPKTAPEHFAYVEWFSPIPITCGPNHRLYKVTRLAHNGHRRASIIPVSSIVRSVHLFPVFGPPTPKEWTAYKVLELCNSFYINPFSDQDNYLVFS
ncbi:hypothetical protein EI94DRAFT_1605749 [Lactarius quietus]|nr:hypothetical protein EI94DRAFT_1605749 [Lactarius quietus]